LTRATWAVSPRGAPFIREKGKGKESKQVPPPYSFRGRKKRGAYWVLRALVLLRGGGEKKGIKRGGGQRKKKRREKKKTARATR